MITTTVKEEHWGKKLKDLVEKKIHLIDPSLIFHF